MKYNIGDVVQLNKEWDNRYGIIVDVSNSPMYKESTYVYRIHVQGNTNPGWMSQSVIIGKVE